MSGSKGNRLAYGSNDADDTGELKLGCTKGHIVEVESKEHSRATKRRVGKDEVID